ncbi:MAG: ion channel, partial [Desulfobacterales bacterium]|nr:ion channel [Desulfobacterales bacterium]
MRLGKNDSGLARSVAQFQHFLSILKKERFFTILAVTCMIILYGALAIFFADRYYVTKGSSGILDAIYWAIVTLTTVGYGDIVPVSKLSKTFALMIIISGPVLLSLVTA